MGNVLLRFDPHIFMDRLGIADEDREILLRQVFRSVEWCRMDRGSLKDTDAASLLSARVPEHLKTAAAALVTRWDDPIIPIEGMAELVQELKGNGYHLFLLSNASSRQHDYWPRIPGSEFFEDTLISCDAGVVKPQPEIYFEALHKFHIFSEESVFIDDSPLNCEGAESTGLSAIVFHGDAGALRKELHDRGVNITV